MIPYSNSKMQDQQLMEKPNTTDRISQTTLKDLTAELGYMSLSENNEGNCDPNVNEIRHKEETVDFEVMQQSLCRGNNRGKPCEGFSGSTTCTLELSGSWGDFEGFSESLCKSDSFNHTFEVLVKSTEATKTDVDLSEEYCSSSLGHPCSKLSVHNQREAPSSSLNEAKHCYEDIFKLGFPEIPVPQSTESIRSLDQVINTKDEDAGLPELLKKQLCIDSGNIWRTFRSTDNTPSLRYSWNTSHCQDIFLSVLGIDASEKDHSEGSKDDVFEDSNVKENEDLKVDGFSFSNCKALIQTKLSVSPDSRRGQLFTYNLFLKRTPSSGNMQYITVPKKKRIFTTHNLKMKIFNSDIC
ncbi:uncharacterized protein CLBA1 [Alligator sinensis]|uniref:Uncharacterized protein CLBA1 n=1 Tax=Alligator sinensis TaxID=38654 RepID=A0A1U7S6Q0_ALLSI|nr:uncharacterized protein CLBA1 [Alligator sinensis]